MSPATPLIKEIMKGPYGWIQWKGTGVCLDVHCSCGERTHVDAEFAYYIKCGKCGQLYETRGEIVLMPVGELPKGVSQYAVQVSE